MSNQDQMIPHNVEAEEAVLGSLLIDPSAYLVVNPLLSPNDFYIEKNGWVYQAIGAAARNGDPDMVTVMDHLEREDRLGEIGGAAYLTRLINAAPCALRAQQYAHLVREYAARRRYIRAASDVAVAAYDLDADLGDVQARAEGAVMRVGQGTGDRRQVDAIGLSNQLYDGFSSWLAEPLRSGEVRGLATGIGLLDEALGGLEPGVYIVAARPSMGKTALLLQMIEGIAGQGQRCILFSIEMSAEQIGRRMATGLARVELQALKQGRTSCEENAQVMDAVAAIQEWPLIIVDQSMLRPTDVLTEVRRVQMQHGDIAAVFVDGLWLMTAARERENRTQTLGSISREMKLIQRELSVPLVMAHQLSRGCEQRADKRPLLSDLRDSGAVEQDTDVALMLYREGAYNPASPDAHIMEIWVRKNRLDGPSGDVVSMYWKGEYMRVEPLAKPAPPVLGRDY